MKVLVIGLGSIARKHILALNVIENSPIIYALRSKRDTQQEENIINIFSWTEVPAKLDFIIISNPTSEHYKTIEKVITFGVPLFIEKPPLMKLLGAAQLLNKVHSNKVKTYTAFNLRFHPVLNWIKDNIADKRVLEVQAYCGSFLPEWRREKDYRNVYSGKKELGGGVHLDLIHELDYIRWIFGDPISFLSRISSISDLEIDSPDCAHYWLEYEKMNISVLLNYYRRKPSRTLEIVFSDDIWVADLLSGSIVDSSDRILFETEKNITDTYMSQMAYFINCIENDLPMMNDLDEAYHTLKICLNDAS